MHQEVSDIGSNGKKKVLSNEVDWIDPIWTQEETDRLVEESRAKELSDMKDIQKPLEIGTKVKTVCNTVIRTWRCMITISPRIEDTCHKKSKNNKKNPNKISITEHTKNLVVTHRRCLPEFFLNPIFFYSNIFSDPNFFADPKIFLDLRFFQTKIFFLTKIFFRTNNFFFKPKSFPTQNILQTQKCLQT